MPLADATFYIYCVAKPVGDESYAMAEDFSQYQVGISNPDWNKACRLTMLAITLSTYAARDEITPLELKTTDDRGDLTFTDFEDGLYLVWGDVLTLDVGDTEWNFRPQPMLLPLP